MSRAQRTPDDINRMYADYITRTDLTSEAVAQLHGMSNVQMLNYFHRYGMPLTRTAGRHRGYRRTAVRKGRDVLTREQVQAIYEAYCTDFAHSAIEVAAQHYVAHSTMLKYFKRYQLPLARRAHHRRRIVGSTAGEVLRLRQQGLTHRQIADGVGCSISTVWRILQREVS